MYDLIIIGAGPAGITAAVYAARKKMDFLVITGDIGGQAAWSGEVDNYLGYQFFPGAELVHKFEEHMRQYDFPLNENETVRELKREGDGFIVRTEKTGYAARTVIVASGKHADKLGVPGESEFRNRGISYCATCDAPLFLKKDVAVIGGGNSALDAVIQLSRLAAKIYVVNKAKQLTGDRAMLDKVLEFASVEVINGSSVTEILGEKMVSGIKIRTKDKHERFLAVQGVFVEIGLCPNSAFVPKELARNRLGEIIVNCSNETNIPGIFSAGDVTDVPEKQIIIAAGEGAKAALSAFRYLARHP